MTRKGPMLTLAGGGALAAVLLVASISAATGGDEPDPEAAADGDATPTPTATASASPEPEAEPEEEPDPVTYVGYVDGGGASVAIVIDDRTDEATAYVCDGASVEAWLSGTARNGELLLSGDNGELVGSYDEEQAIGETAVQGIDWTFTIDEVAPPEGLYQFADTVIGGAEVDGGWIVLPDGTQVGIVNVDGEPAAAPELDPATGEVELEGETVVADQLS